MLVFLLESLVFILVGFELPYAVRALRHHSPGTLLQYGLAISAVLIGVRLLWVFPSAYLPRFMTRSRPLGGRRVRDLPPWQWVVFVGWAGMRGADSLVIALALPLTTAAGTPFPARDLIIFVTFSVIFTSLVVQGPSLRPLLRVLRLGDDGRAETEEVRARKVAAEVGLRRLEEVASADDVQPEVVQYLRKTHKERELVSYRQLRANMITAERQAVVELRDTGVIGDGVMRRVQRDLDLETMLLESAKDGAPESPYEP
jgi:CPA1 family monovalent cation:H+ antiporter